MAKITDLGEVRRKKQMGRIIKGIAVILVILLVTFAAASVINNKKMMGAESFFDLFQSGGGYPIEAPGGRARGMYSLDGLLTVINDTDLIMYNGRGAAAFQVKHHMAKPVVSIQDDMMLMLDQGSKSYALYNKNVPVIDSKADRTIYTGATSAKGGYAIATRSDDYLSQVSVYNKSNQIQYTWNYSDKLVTHLALSPSGDRLAVCGVFTEDGIIKSQMLLYYKGELIDTRDFEDSLICSVQFENENTIRGVSDKEAFLLSGKGKLLGEFDYRSQPLAAFVNTPQATVLLLGDYRQMGGYRVVSLTDEMTRQSTADIKGHIHSIKADAVNIYILAGSHYYQIDRATGDILAEQESDYLYDLQPIGRSVYAISGDEIIRMTQVQGTKRQTEDEVIPQKPDHDSDPAPDMQPEKPDTDEPQEELPAEPEENTDAPAPVEPSAGEPGL